MIMVSSIGLSHLQQISLLWALIVVSMHVSQKMRLLNEKIFILCKEVSRMVIREKLTAFVTEETVKTTLKFIRDG